MEKQSWTGALGRGRARAIALVLALVGLAGSPFLAALAQPALGNGLVARAWLPFLGRQYGPHAPPPTGTPARPLPSATLTRIPSATRTLELPPSATSSPTPPAAPSPSPPASDCDPIVTFADGIRPSVELHVAVGGDDRTADGSPERPFASIAAAAHAARPGAAIRVHSGRYQGGQWVENLRGSAGAPIWLGGAPGEEPPLIEGGGEGLHLVRPAYVVLHDLVVQDARHNGINCDDGGDYADPTAAHHLVFRGLAVHDIGGTGNEDCLKLSGVRDFLVVDSRFAACGGGGSGSGIDLVGCHRGAIVRNHFRDHSANAVQVKGGSSEIEIRRNWMERAGQRAVNMGGSTGAAYFRPPLSTGSPNAEARRVQLVANVIIGGLTPFAFVGCVDCLAAHNTIINPERWSLRILQETVSSADYVFEPCSRGRVLNNLFYFSRRQVATDVNIGPNTAPDTFTFRHNLWYAWDDPGRSQPVLPVTEVGAVIGRDPKLDVQYAIGPESPAFSAGLPGLGIRADFRGNCYRDPPSIGAYEVGSKEP